MSTHVIRVSLTAAALLAGAVLIPAQADTPSERAPTTAPAPAITGRSRVTFKDRNPLGEIEELNTRFRTNVSASEKPYILADESFELYVPELAEADAKAPKDAKPGEEKKPYGLLVWVSPSEDGAPPANYLPVLDKHRLIWVGANKTGNEHKMDRRLGLALDAAMNIAKRYAIDPARVYVGGASGGGRVASMLAPNFPDVFSGGYYLIGCNYFRPLPSPDNPEVGWRATFNVPLRRNLEASRKNLRVVMLTGESDENRLQTLATYKSGYTKDNFEHVTYLEVPKMGHTLPDAEWFEKGILALEVKKAKAEGEAAPPAKSP